MREIKFRAWTGSQMEYKIMAGYLGHFYVQGMSEQDSATMSNMNTVYDKMTPLMQYTGLKDKSGKEIYEGDLIVSKVWDKPYSIKRKEWDVIREVYWYKGFNHSEKRLELNPRLKNNPSLFNQNPQFSAKIVKGNDGGYDWSEFHDCEVIGNIYENPELLKQD